MPLSATFLTIIYFVSVLRLSSFTTGKKLRRSLYIKARFKIVHVV